MQLKIVGVHFDIYIIFIPGLDLRMTGESGNLVI